MKLRHISRRRNSESKIVKRKGRIYVINRKNK